MNRLGINRAGRELINAGVAATNNFIAGITLINKDLKAKYPQPASSGAPSSSRRRPTSSKAS